MVDIGQGIPLVLECGSPTIYKMYVFVCISYVIILIFIYTSLAFACGSARVYIGYRGKE